MELYLLKSSLILSIFYTFYWFVLRKETFFTWNRIYLVTSLLVSMLLPFTNLANFESLQEGLVYITSPIVIPAIGNTHSLANNSELTVFSIIYISGVVFFTLRFLSRLSQIFYLYNRFPKVRFNGFKAVIVNGDQSPFTFFSILFLSKADYNDGKLTEMIVHEKAHRDQLHTLDLIILEFITIIQWFNPFIWLFRIAIKSEHEFIADEKVLNEGYDKVAYQKLLFEKSLGLTSLGVTSNFNYSLLKNRLKMMTIKKSSSFAKTKYLISLPLLFIISVLLTYNITIAAQKVYDKVDRMPVYPSGESGLRTFIAQNTFYPANAAELGVQARVFISFVVSDKGFVKDVKIFKTDLKTRDANGNLIDSEYKSDEDPKRDLAIKELEKEALRVISMLEKFTPGMKDNKPVNVQFTFPITFILQ